MPDQEWPLSHRCVTHFVLFCFLPSSTQSLACFSYHRSAACDGVDYRFSVNFPPLWKSPVGSESAVAYPCCLQQNLGVFLESPLQTERQTTIRTRTCATQRPNLPLAHVFWTVNGGTEYKTEPRRMCTLHTERPQAGDLNPQPSCFSLPSTSCSQGKWGCWISQLSWGEKAAIQAEPIASSWQGQMQRQRFIRTHTPTSNSEFPVDLTCMFLDCERKLKFQERTYADTLRTCKNTHRKSPALGIEPKTLLCGSWWSCYCASNWSCALATWLRV